LTARVASARPSKPRADVLPREFYDRPTEIVARDLLYESGWTQLTERDPQGSYCLTGALSHAAGQDRQSYRNALLSLGPRLGVPGCRFGGFACHCAALRWNDAEGRTRRHVVAKLDEFIELALGKTAASA